MNHSISFAPRTLADLVPRPADRTRAFARDAALVVGFAVFTALLAQVEITLGFTPVPITGQTLAVLLAGTSLGWARGGLSQLVYWLVGMVVPFNWYAGDRGWEAATGASAGYLVGFIVAAAAVGYLAEQRQDRKLATSIPAMLAGTAVIYTFGALWLAHSINVPVANGDPNAISLGVAPFLIGDLIKLVIAGAITPLAWRLAQRD